MNGLFMVVGLVGVCALAFIGLLGYAAVTGFIVLAGTAGAAPLIALGVLGGATLLGLLFLYTVINNGVGDH